MNSATLPGSKKAIVFAVCVLFISLNGCGPGLPLMTKEQEDLVSNVDLLLKENESLKQRLSGIEKGDAIKGRMEELTARLAETNYSIDKLRQEFSFVQGTIEENQHEKEGLRETLASLKASIDKDNGRLTNIEAKSKDADRLFSDIQAGIDALDKRVLAIEARKEAGGEEGAVDGPEALYNKGYKQVLDRDFSSAIGTFVEFLAAYPEHRLSANARYWLGETYYARGDYEMAIVEFDRAIKKYPSSDKAPASLLKQAYSFEKLNAKKEALLLFKELIEKYPKSPEAGLAKKKLKTKD